MKRAMALSICILLFLTALYPIGVGITACFGYRFTLISIPAFAITIVLLSTLLTTLSAVYEYPFPMKWTQVLLALLAPLSMINALFYVLECPQILVVASVLLSAGCSCYLTVKHGKGALLRTVALILFAVMLLPVGFSGCVGLLFGGIRQDTVVQTAASPSGKYYAQVIDSNQGALGGDTFVDVYEKSNINVILFKIEKNPRRVYCGEWGEFESMRIYWEDDTCLIINSVAYKIN